MGGTGGKGQVSPATAHGGGAIGPPQGHCARCLPPGNRAPTRVRGGAAGWYAIEPQGHGYLAIDGEEHKAGNSSDSVPQGRPTNYGKTGDRNSASGGRKGTAVGSGGKSVKSLGKKRAAGACPCDAHSSREAGGDRKGAGSRFNHGQNVKDNGIRGGCVNIRGDG